MIVYSLGPLGHVTPVVPIVRAAIDARHEVLVITELEGVQAFARFGVDALGLDHGNPRISTDVEALRTDSSVRAGGTPNQLLGWVPRVAGVIDALIDQVNQYRPDIVLRDVAAFAGLLAGEACGVPVATYEWTPPPTAMFASTVGGPLDVIRARLGLSSDPELSGVDRWLRLVLAPPWWGRGTDHLPPTAHRIRPAPPPAEAGPTWLTELRLKRAVYATLGTVFNRTEGVLAAVLEGLSRIEDLHVVSTVGADVDPASFNGLPKRVRVERFVPQTAVFGVVDAVVAHGGYGTLMGALASGLPVVSIPLAAADNVINARSMAATGAGLVIEDHERTADVVEDRTRRVLEEPSFAAAARRTAADIGALPGPEYAVEMLERLATTKQAVLRDG